MFRLVGIVESQLYVAYCSDFDDCCVASAFPVIVRMIWNLTLKYTPRQYLESC